MYINVQYTYIGNCVPLNHNLLYCVVPIYIIHFYFCLLAEHGLHNWLNTRPGGNDDIAAMSLIDNDANTSFILIDQSVCTYLYLPIYHITLSYNIILKRDLKL